MTIASILSDLWMGGGAFEAPPGPGTPKTPRRNRVNVFVYWSDGLGDRAFDRHSRNGGRGICQRKLLAGPGILPFFSNARRLPGEGERCSRLELTRTLAYMYLLVLQLHVQIVKYNSSTMYALRIIL